MAHRIKAFTPSTRDTANARRTTLRVDYGERLPSLGCELLLRLLPAISSIHPTAWFAFLHTPWKICFELDLDSTNALGTMPGSITVSSKQQAIGARTSIIRSNVMRGARVIHRILLSIEGGASATDCLATNGVLTQAESASLPASKVVQCSPPG